jgi:hypothetical protein
MLAAAAAAGPLRRPRSPPASQPPTPAQVNPRWALAPSPTTSWPNPSSESPEFWPPAPPAMAKGHIAWPQFFPGTSAQNCNFNSKFNLLILVNSVENSGKLRKMQNQFCWIHGGKYYNFSHSHKFWFWIFLTWKIGLWNTLICHNSKTITPLHPSFGYVGCLVMTSSCAKSCTKLCSKYFLYKLFSFSAETA